MKKRRHYKKKTVLSTTPNFLKTCQLGLFNSNNNDNYNDNNNNMFMYIAPFKNKRYKEFRRNKEKMYCSSQDGRK